MFNLFNWLPTIGFVVLMMPTIMLRAAEDDSAINKPANPPNIIVVFSDDHAQAALSCYGSKLIQTPHLDALAARGIRFSNSFVTNSICTPSRATLLTGQYSHKNGNPVFNEFDGSQDHFVKRLQVNGYHTGIFGKWHLGSMPTGFDRWAILPGQGVYEDPALLVPGGRVDLKGHCTPLTMELGIEFMKTRPKNKPFFVMINPKAPHRDWVPDPKNKKRYAEKQFPEPPTFWDEYRTRPAALPENDQTIANDLTNNDLKLPVPDGLKGPELIRWRSTKPKSITADGKTLTGVELVKWKYQRYMQDYLACVQGVDDSIGQLNAYLKENNLEQNTIVIYTTDNGWYLGEFGMYDKRFMYEPGLRTPLIMAGPGIAANKVADAFVANIDLAPTFLAMAGVEVPQ